MSVFVEIAGVKLFTGMTVAEIEPLTTATIAAMTVYELQAFENTHVVIEPTPEIAHRIEERSTAQLEIWDPEEHHEFDYGQEVIIRDAENRLFGGLIETPSKVCVSPVEDTGWMHSISCIDYQALADRRQFFHAYESETAENIVGDILEILAEEEVTTGEIQAGPTLEMITFNGVSCAEALDRVSERAGFTWWIDEWKRLYFVVRTTYDAAWDIVDGQELQNNPPPRLTIGNPEYRNVQYLIAGNAETSTLTQEFHGDGKNQSFTVGFPIAREPTVYVNDVEKTVGIGGVETGFDFYWNEDSQVVTQELTDPALIVTDTLKVEYVGKYKLITKVTQSSEVTRQQLAQGFGTGKIEKSYRDASLKSQDTALEAAQAKLAAYATIGRKLEYDTLLDDLAVGVMQTVTMPKFGLDAAEMLIYSMKITFPDTVTTYTIEACEGPIEESWQKLFCDIVDELRRAAAEQAAEVDVVQGLEEFEKTWLATDHPNPFIKVYPDCLPSDPDLPCLANEDRLAYCALYNNVDAEFFRKAITYQTTNDDVTEIYTTVLILAEEANDVQITAVALWGGDLATLTLGTGIEMEKHTYNKLKNSLESLQLDFTDIKGW